jgi:hypothetical protein
MDAPAPVVNQGLPEASAMLGTHSSNFPPEVRQRLHPEFLANEESYMRLRDSLLDRYRGQWVAVTAQGVVAASPNLLAVMEAASAHGGHPYVACVGMEESIVFRSRRAVFPYDQAYHPFPLPRIIATFSNDGQTRAQTHGDVIPDTGSDICLLPDGDCLAIDLFQSPSLTGFAGGWWADPVPPFSTTGRSKLMALASPRCSNLFPADRNGSWAVTS